MHDKDFYTPEEVAKLANVPLSTVSIWMLQGLPWLLSGNRLLLEKENVYEWVEAHKN